jgi:phosphotransferase system HPr-like phosphotransfer protein
VRRLARERHERRPGVRITTDGEDEDAAIAGLGALIESGLGETLE